MNQIIQNAKSWFSQPADVPRSGEYVMDGEGKLFRIVSQADYIQPCTGSFYVGGDSGEPWVSFSGGLKCPMETKPVRFTKRTMIARFWTFKDCEVKAHNGVNFEIEVPVWETAETI
jgi:hypothetical protein